MDLEGTNILELWDSVAFLPSFSSPILLRVYSGAIDAHQLRPFEEALDLIKLDKVSHKVEIMSNADVRIRTNWGPKELIEWLLGSNVHFILTHIHQGLESCQWDIAVLYEQVQRLRYHPGFPSGAQLQCPIFTQDKFEYISSVPELCNHTLSIELTADGNYHTAEISEKIDRYMS